MQHEPQPLWQEILRLHQEEPVDLWVWGGDNIYADRRRPWTERAYLYLQGDKHASDMFEAATPSKLRAEYQRQLRHPGYASLVRNIPVVGVWDDHDYGINDGNKNFVDKSESKEVFLDFIGAPKNDPRRSQDGVYSVHVVGSGEHTIKVILLDVRYNRDPWSHQEGYDTAAQDVLGDEQWQWLHQQLDKSTARVHLIFSGIQVFHQYAFPMAETWVKFGPAKDRLLDLLTALNVSAPILISGDVHYAEMSRASCLCDETGETSQIIEVTSSGLTHTWESSNWPKPWVAGLLFTLTFKWYNVVSSLLGLHPHRIGAYGSLNFGTISVDWSRQRVQATIHGEEGEVALTQEWDLGALDQVYSAKCARSQHTVCGHPSRPKWYMTVGLVLVLVPHAIAVLLLVKAVCKVTKLALKSVKALLSLCRGGSATRQITQKKKKNT